jgi:hypothetical protein
MFMNVSFLIDPDFKKSRVMTSRSSIGFKNKCEKAAVTRRSKAIKTEISGLAAFWFYGPTYTTERQINSVDIQISKR